MSTLDGRQLCPLSLLIQLVLYFLQKEGKVKIECRLNIYLLTRGFHVIQVAVSYNVRVPYFFFKNYISIFIYNEFLQPSLSLQLSSHEV